MIMPITCPYIVKFICISQIRKQNVVLFWQRNQPTYIGVEEDTEEDTEEEFRVLLVYVILAGWTVDWSRPMWHCIMVAYGGIGYEEDMEEELCVLLVYVILPSRVDC